MSSWKSKWDRVW